MTSRTPTVESQRGARGDAVSVLTIYLALLFVLPSRLVIAAIGAVGRPAALLGMGCFIWWAVCRLVPTMNIPGRQPVRRAVIAFGFVTLTSYTLGFARGLPGIEARASDRVLLTTVGLLGVALVASDGIVTRRRLDTLLRRLVSFGGLLSVMGSVQFWLGINIAQKIQVPGLVLNNSLVGIGERGDAGLRRVAGTTGHPIEFGVVLAMLLPIALHYALFAKDDWERRWRWVIVGIMISSSLYSVSRSAVIGLGVGLAVLVLFWVRRLQFNALVLGTVFLGAFRFVVPGLLGTLRSLFANSSEDPSVTGRTNDYPIVLDFVERRPWFGRGVGTFLPEEYLLLDNQYLGTLVTTGFAGLAALLLVLLTGWACGFVVARERSAPEEDRHLGAAIAASIASGIAVSATFDSLGFAVIGGCLFLLIGAGGALWRLHSTDDRRTDPSRAPILRGGRHEPALRRA